KAEIQLWLARRFPQPDLPARLEPIASHAAPGGQLVPEPVGGERVRVLSSQLVPEPVATRVQWPKVAPLSRQRFLLQAPIPQRAYDKLRYIQALLGHAVPSGDLAEVLERSFDAHIAQLEKQKIGATSRARGQRAAEDPRHIPTAVKRTVWESDGGPGRGGETREGCSRGAGRSSRARSRAQRGAVAAAARHRSDRGTRGGSAVREHDGRAPRGASQGGAPTLAPQNPGSRPRRIVR